MRTSIRTSILRVLSAAALAVAVAGSTGPASAHGGGGSFHGGGGFHGGGFHGGGFGGHGFANRGFHQRFRGRGFAFGGSPGWGGYCSPYWWAVNPWACY
jgi:hypothetical protein